MPSESFCLAAQSRLDSKWLKTDIQLAFTRDGLCGLWNEMVKDGEIVYTGTELTQNRELPSRKDDGVDAQSGTKKEDLNDKEKKEEEETPAPVYRAKSILESWVWGKQPGIILSDSSGSNFCLLMEVSKIKICLYYSKIWLI